MLLSCLCAIHSSILLLMFTDVKGEFQGLWSYYCICEKGWTKAFVAWERVVWKLTQPVGLKSENEKWSKSMGLRRVSGAGRFIHPSSLLVCHEPDSVIREKNCILQLSIFLFIQNYYEWQQYQMNWWFNIQYSVFRLGFLWTTETKPIKPLLSFTVIITYLRIILYSSLILFTFYFLVKQFELHNMLWKVLYQQWHNNNNLYYLYCIIILILFVLLY